MGDWDDDEEGYATGGFGRDNSGASGHPRLTVVEQMMLGIRRRSRLDPDTQARHEAFLGMLRTPEGRELRAALTSARRLPTADELTVMRRDTHEELTDALLFAFPACRSAPPIALALWLHELCWRLVEAAHGSHRCTGTPPDVIEEVLTRQLASMEAVRHASASWALPSVLRHMGVDAHRQVALAVGRLEILHGQLALMYGDEPWPVDTLLMVDVAHRALRDRWRETPRSSAPDLSGLNRRLAGEVEATVKSRCAVTHAVEQSFTAELDASAAELG